MAANVSERRSKSAFVSFSLNSSSHFRLVGVFLKDRSGKTLTDNNFSKSLLTIFSLGIELMLFVTTLNDWSGFRSAGVFFGIANTGDSEALGTESPNLLKVFSPAKVGVGGAKLSFSDALEYEDFNLGDESMAIAEGLRGSRIEKLTALLFRETAYKASFDIGTETELAVLDPGLVRDRATGGGTKASFSLVPVG